MSKKVFIIGNGFDLDLGMNTRYSDFVKSNKWPSGRYIGRNLHTHLSNRAHLSKWFDLEKELLIYSKLEGRESNLHHYKSLVGIDKEFFEHLVNSLTAYIREEEAKDVRDYSFAAEVFRTIIKSRKFSSIYSFNYTNLYKIAAKLGIRDEFKYDHVHGSVKNNDIILGVEEKSDLIPGYQFLYKTYSPHYESHSIQYDMLEAEEVVFFGHSLGHNDYHYFEAFFQEQCRDGMKRSDGKRITIFTYDDPSRIEILDQLRQMNDKKTDLLFNLNQMQFICTKEGGGERLERFLERIG